MPDKIETQSFIPKFIRHSYFKAPQVKFLRL